MRQIVHAPVILFAINGDVPEFAGDVSKALYKYGDETIAAVSADKIDQVKEYVKDSYVTVDPFRTATVHYVDSGEREVLGEVVEVQRGIEKLDIIPLIHVSTGKVFAIR